MSTRHAVMAGLLALFAPTKRAGAVVEARRVTTLDVVVMLDAIAAVETGGNPYRIGRAGERGRCQFLHETWVRYTNADFALWASRDTELTRRVERAHLAHLLRLLVPPGQIPDPALIAAAWRHGPGQAVRHVRSDYARRAANLYWDAIGRKGQ